MERRKERSRNRNKRIGNEKKLKDWSKFLQQKEEAGEEREKTM